jgi:hypothetical protein
MSVDRSGYKFAKGRNSGLRRNGQRSPALSGGQKEDLPCAISEPCVAVASALAVIPAVSLTVSPASSREKPITETQGSQLSSKSGCQSIPTKPNCYACIHRRELVGDAHSRCANPRISSEDAIISPMLLLTGKIPPAMKRLNVTASQHGIRSGWFMWPMNFDPTWLESCDGFAAKEQSA